MMVELYIQSTLDYHSFYSAHLSVRLYRKFPLIKVNDNVDLKSFKTPPKLRAFYTKATYISADFKFSR